MKKSAMMLFAVCFGVLSMVGLSFASVVTLVDENGEPGPTLEIMSAGKSQPLTVNASRSVAPYTIMCNTFVMEQQDWENQECSQAWGVRPDVTIVFGAYFDLLTVSPKRVLFRLVVDGPDFHKTWTAWFPDYLEQDYYVAVVKGTTFTDTGLFNASLTIWPDGGKMTKLAAENSRFLISEEN